MSANDAAVALGEEVSGDLTSFVKLMNKRAKELGATNTHFANPNGLHLANHYSTAYDLYLIFKEVAKHNEFSILREDQAVELNIQALKDS